MLWTTKCWWSFSSTESVASEDGAGENILFLLTMAWDLQMSLPVSRAPLFWTWETELGREGQPKRTGVARAPQPSESSPKFNSEKTTFLHKLASLSVTAPQGDPALALSGYHKGLQDNVCWDGCSGQEVRGKFWYVEELPWLRLPARGWCPSQTETGATEGEGRKRKFRVS